MNSLLVACGTNRLVASFSSELMKSSEYRLAECVNRYPFFFSMAASGSMAKCEEGYLCEICGKDVEEITDSDLYLRFVIGMLDPETLHTASERHIRCNPTLAQFIVDARFDAIQIDGPFDKRQLDPDYVRQRERLVTRGWKRLREVAPLDIPIVEYPLPEIIDAFQRRAES